MPELQQSRLGVEYQDGTLPTLRAVSSEHQLSRKRTYGLAMEFAAENRDQFTEFVEENADE